MKRVVVGMVGALTAMSLWLAYPANADSNSFISDAHAAGFFNDGGDATMLQAGYQVCVHLSNGLDGEQEAQNLYQISHINSIQQARSFVIIAVEDLCPA